MENDTHKDIKKASSSEAAIQRGKEAIKADETINKKDLDAAKVKEEGEKDAEQWRNEG